MNIKSKVAKLPPNSSNTGFTLSQTNIAKGIACILLLFHHLFYSESSYERFISLCLFAGNVPFESYFAVSAKVCVAIFLLLSGYGINETLNKRLSLTPNKKVYTTLRTTLRLLWKLWISYAIIFILFVPWQGLFDRHPYTSIYDVVLDFLGFSFLFKTPTMNATWWYMSVALLSYMLIPILKPLLSRYKGLYIVLSFIIFILFTIRSHSIFWIFFFMIGMLLSEIKFFDHIATNKSKSIYNWTVCLIAIFASLVLRKIFDDTTMFDLIFGLSIILFSYLCISRLKYANSVFEFIGKHSGNIFMFHTFIYSYNFRSFIYSPTYAPFILLLLLAVCLVVSICIEYIKKITHLQKGIDYISQKL